MGFLPLNPSTLNELSQFVWGPRVKYLKISESAKSLDSIIYILNLLRIKLLFAVMKFAIPPKKDVKKEAKYMKAFCILIKKKLQRQQVCRDANFRKLMALVFDPDEQERALPNLIAITQLLLCSYTN